MNAAQRVAALRRLLARGMTLEAAGAQLRPPLSKSTVHRLAQLYDLPRGRRWKRPATDALSQDQHSLLLRIARVSQALAAGMNVTEASAVIALSKSAGHRLMVYHRLPHRRRGMDPLKKGQLEKLVKSAASRPATIARLLGVSKSTVSAEERKELDQVGAFRPKQLKRPQLCPHPDCRQPLAVTPCPACAARAWRREQGLPP